MELQVMRTQRRDRWASLNFSTLQSAGEERTREIAHAGHRGGPQT